jgi:branched-chain amino acid transport system permease protein
MMGALLAGLALGAIYGLAATGIVMTYVSAGVMNLGYAALAYFVARFYYYLHIQQGWGIPEAAVLSIVIVGPLMGVVLWLALFRFIRLASQLIKIVVTIGLSVCISPIAILLFGNKPIVTPPGLAPEPVHVFHVLGTTVTLDQLIVYACVIVVVAGGAAVMAWTNLGLTVRAVVDSDAMASLSGVNPSKVAMGVWAVSTFIAGLSGVLVAPLIGLDIDAFTVLIAAAFAAVVAAEFTHVGRALLGGLLMGVVTGLIQYYLPPSSTFTADVVPSIPFAFIFLFLAYAVIRRGHLRETTARGGPLDVAIAPQGGSEVALARAASVLAGSGTSRRSIAIPVIGVAIVAILPAVLHGVWLAQVGLGLAYAIVFLSWTVVAGEGGMIWLCQISFAGIGAYVTAELATKHGWPVLAAMVAGGLVCAVVGTIIGALTVRLGELYVAMATLAFGVLVATLVLQVPSLDNFGLGISLGRPSFAEGSRGFGWFALGVFCVMSLLVANVRRSTFGMAMSAARWSDSAARMSGIRVVSVKVGLSAIAAFIAGLGGGVLACYMGGALPSEYDAFSGLIWLAVLVTVGIRSNGAALVAGLMFSFVPEIVTAYLPTAWGEVPPALFGLGAILVARNPEGTVAMHARQLEWILTRHHAASPTDLLIGQGMLSMADADIAVTLGASDPTATGR